VRRPCIVSLFEVQGMLNPLQSNDLPLSVRNKIVLFRPVPHNIPIVSGNVPTHLPQLAQFFIHFYNFLSDSIITVFAFLSSLFEFYDVIC
jgi:hypothetical protein